MKFQYLSLLSLAFLGLQQPVFSKRHGGGGSSDDSSSSDSSLDSSSQPYCYTLPQPSSYIEGTKNWLHKLIGTYYNGSIEIKVKISETDQTCGDQNGVFTVSYDGVLTLAETPSGVKGSNISPFVFLLTGWKSGTVPTSEVEVTNNYLPSDVLIYMNAYTDPRDPWWNGSAYWDLEANQQGSGYDFTGVMDDSSSAAYDDSQWALNIPPCNGSDPTLFTMNPFDSFDFTYDSEADYNQQRNKVNGTFDSSSATIDFIGQFTGSFHDSTLSTGGTKFGRYLMSFSGTVENQHSHTLVTTGSNLPWQANPSITVTSTPTTTCISQSSAISFRSGFSKTMYGMVIMVMVIVASL